MIDLHRGQGMDIYWRCSSKCPSEQEYKDMVIRSEFFKRLSIFKALEVIIQLFFLNSRNWRALRHGSQAYAALLYQHRVSSLSIIYAVRDNQ